MYPRFLAKINSLISISLKIVSKSWVKCTIQSSCWGNNLILIKLSLCKKKGKSKFWNRKLKNSQSKNRTMAKTLLRCSKKWIKPSNSLRSLKINTMMPSSCQKLTTKSYNVCKEMLLSIKHKSTTLNKNYRKNLFIIANLQIISYRLVSSMNLLKKWWRK